MSPAKKRKIKTCTDAPLQLLPEYAKKGAATAAECYIEISLEERKKDADKPLYLKRI